VCICNPSYAKPRDLEDLSQKLALDKSRRPYPKDNRSKKRAEGAVQVLECLPSKCEALSSNPRKRSLSTKPSELELPLSQRLIGGVILGEFLVERKLRAPAFLECGRNGRAGSR
jgi:hypothetical protein